MIRDRGGAHLNDNHATARRTLETIDQMVGSRVRQALREASVTESAAANLLGVSRIELLDILDGRRRCSPVALQIISLVAGKGIAWFFMDPEKSS